MIPVALFHTSSKASNSDVPRRCPAAIADCSIVLVARQRRPTPPSDLYWLCLSWVPSAWEVRKAIEEDKWACEQLSLSQVSSVLNSIEGEMLV